MSGDAVLLFDGECGLCHRAVHFLFRRDPAGRLRYAPLDSAAGARLLAGHPLLARDRESLVLVEAGQAFVRSEGALRAACRLAWPWPWLAAVGLRIPRKARDWAYDQVARRRHRTPRACPPPPPGLAARMVESSLEEGA